MTVHEAIDSRRSFRAFLPKPVEKEKLTAILEASQRTPSWANSQPWDIFVVSGKPLETIKAGFAKKRAESVTGNPEVEFPREWTDDAKRRQKQLGPDMERDCGPAVKEFGKLNHAFFNAPTVIYLCLDKVLSHWSLYDLGAYSMTLLLAATEQGLGGIQAAQMVVYPEIIREAVNIPENLRIAMGIAVGYVDASHGINNLRSSRDTLDKIVRWAE